MKKQIKPSTDFGVKRGMFNITRAVIPHLKSGAAFVNVASIAGLSGTAGFAVYCASKYGVIGFSKSVALELGSKGIRVNIVAPGYIGQFYVLCTLLLFCSFPAKYERHLVDLILLNMEPWMTDVGAYR
jgi:NAD(P)-dependent dehydrogenase (short-subunit alcohol dehydrogenase family)